MSVINGFVAELMGCGPEVVLGGRGIDDRGQAGREAELIRRARAGVDRDPDARMADIHISGRRSCEPSGIISFAVYFVGGRWTGRAGRGFT
jgi:hypothetical protein